MDLQGKVAIVTGSDSGIGKAIALGFAAKGAAVTINYYKDQASAEQVHQQIIQNGGKAQVIQGDVSQISFLQELIDRTVQAFGRLDIMVNNAGMETRTSILDSTEQDFDRVIGVDLKGAFFGTQLAAKQMIAEKHGGRIINISSIHEDRPMPGNIPYCCAKGGMRMLTRTAGVELAPHGITVVGIAPGAIATPINTETLQDPQKVQKLNSAIPAGRVGQPDEIAHLATWLASDESNYVTACTYFIDGGLAEASLSL